ncbi:unnamed protein product, partial [Heterotrigona itama]
TKTATLSTSSSGLPKWRQSPINLCKTATWKKKFLPLYMTNYWLNEGTATMTNTGKTVSIEFSDRTLPTLRGGPLGKDEFQFMNVQFRWGPDNSLGAEHSINGIWLANVFLKFCVAKLPTFQVFQFHRTQVLYGSANNALEHSLRIDREVLRQTRWNCDTLLSHAGEYTYHN